MNLIGALSQCCARHCQLRQYAMVNDIIGKILSGLILHAILYALQIYVYVVC